MTRPPLPADLSAGLPPLPADFAPPGARVVVAMSGGVDSSVVAALVRAHGYDAVGVTLQLYDHGKAVQRAGSCCAGQDIRDARRVADALGMPHYVLDYESRFRADVIAPFADAYAAGETPIPCVACNRTVKFRDLLGVARELGAAALATGHYVRRVAGPEGPELHRAADPARDQSYFLYATTPAQLDLLRFPLGDLPKDETRRIAAALGLAVAAKPDSQDICFVPQGRYSDVVARLRPDAAAPGDIVDLAGRVLGRHDGVMRYTVGQRRGLGLPPTDPAAEPLYVVRLDPAARRVVVGPRAALAVAALDLREMNWLSADAARAAGAPGGLAAAVKLRSTRAALAARLHVAADATPRVALADAEEGVAPGQACVVYGGTRVLGGGTIARTRRSEAADDATDGAAPGTTPGTTPGTVSGRLPAAVGGLA